MLGQLIFSIYINDLADELSSNAKSFADDSSWFSVVRSIDSFADELNNDLAKIRHWTHQRKISFNPDHSKQAQEVIFIRIINKGSHPHLTFNNNIVYQDTSQKHLGIILDNGLSFESYQV